MPERIYILVNSSMPNLVKIGRTARPVEERAAELSNSTNMPTRFVVAYEDCVCDGPLAERLVHELLGESGYRVSANREFFDAPLKVALGVVQEVVSRLRVTDDESHLDSARIEAASSLDEHALLKQAIAHFAGDENTLQSNVKAFTYFERAAALGSSMAHKFIALGYFTGRIGKLSGAKALEHLERAVNLGDRSCYKDMWEVYGGRMPARDSINIANSELCFRWFLESPETDIGLMDLLDYVLFRHSVTCGGDDKARALPSSDIGGQHTSRVLDLLCNRLNLALRDCASSGQMPPATDQFSPMGAYYLEGVLVRIFSDSDDYMRQVFAGVTRSDLRACFAEAKDPEGVVRQFSRYLTAPEARLDLKLPVHMEPETATAPRPMSGFWRRLFVK